MKTLFSSTAKDVSTCAACAAPDRRRRSVLAAMGGLAAMPFATRAQRADQPYRIIVAYVPGGTSDLVARSLTQRLGEFLGQQVIVENRPGAAGNIALDLAARANADGRTLLLSGPGQLAVNPLLYSNLRHQPLKALVPVSMVGEMAHVITVTKSFPATTLAEYVAYAKAHPDEVTFGSSGVGTTTHLCGALFGLHTDIELKHVAYKGAGQAMSDLIAGHITSLFDLLPSSLPQIGNDNIRPLATTGKTRAAQLPDVPTVSESGYPDFWSTSWHALMAPTGTPPDVVARISAAVAETVADAEVQRQLQNQGVKTMPMSPDASLDFLNGEVARWSEVIKAAGITVDNS